MVTTDEVKYQVLQEELVQQFFKNVERFPQVKPSFTIDLLAPLVRFQEGLIAKQQAKSRRQSSMIRMYIREKGPQGAKGKPIGLVLARWDGYQIRYGWSLCHALDKFDPKVAEEMAQARTNAPLGDTGDVPFRVRKALNYLAVRAVKKWVK
jgi:hypothetical protein